MIQAGNFPVRHLIPGNELNGLSELEAVIQVFTRVTHQPLQFGKSISQF
jgi:hypothetical protein